MSQEVVVSAPLGERGEGKGLAIEKTRGGGLGTWRDRELDLSMEIFMGIKYKMTEI